MLIFDTATETMSDFVNVKHVHNRRLASMDAILPFLALIGA